MCISLCILSVVTIKFSVSNALFGSSAGLSIWWASAFPLNFSPDSWHSSIFSFFIFSAPIVKRPFTILSDSINLFLFKNSFSLKVFKHSSEWISFSLSKAGLGSSSRLVNSFCISGISKNFSLESSSLYFYKLLLQLLYQIQWFLINEWV